MSVTTDLLKQVLCLPHSTDIIGMKHDPFSDRVDLILSDHHFPPVGEGAEPPEVTGAWSLVVSDELVRTESIHFNGYSVWADGGAIEIPGAAEENDLVIEASRAQRNAESRGTQRKPESPFPKSATSG
jgi:hypothetical protein